ncbi:MAG: hypothetical protein DDT27_00329 [Dehalococcoidia bacterium]|nr:hypothetical protein [Chloroflexota bacterium]
MLFVTRVTDDFQEVGIAPDPTAVFGRASTSTRKTDGIAYPWLRWQNSLNQDLVFPTIAEVVLVDEPGFLPWCYLTQLGLSRVLHLQTIEVAFWIRLAELRASNPELVQVGIGPAHGHLQNQV